jgi:hypothetical protein
VPSEGIELLSPEGAVGAQPRLGRGQPWVTQAAGANPASLHRRDEACALERPHVFHEPWQRHRVLGGQRGHGLVPLPEPNEHGAAHRVGQGREGQVQALMMNHEVNYCRDPDGLSSDRALTLTLAYPPNNL